ncbi:hypothetical protein P4V64_19480 [Bacillus thuringiensis]|nr:hypothetical protein [Bacillus thuringiensis]
MFSNFKGMVQSVEGRLRELRKKQEELTEQLQTLSGEHTKMLADEAFGQPVTPKELTTKKADIEKVEKEIAAVEQQISAIEQTKRERLREEVPALYQEFREKMTQKEDEFKSKSEELRKKKAEYLLYLRDFGMVTKEMRDIHETFKYMARHATDEYESLRFTVPYVNLFDNSSGDDKMNAPINREIIAAYEDGKVPHWVAYFDETGEVLPSDAEVFTKRAQEGSR